MAETEAGRREDGLLYEALERSVAVRSCGFFFDFDGVLAMIQIDPEAVAPVPGVVSQIFRLASLADKVAIISARPVQFLARHFGQRTAVALYGMYGLEAIVGGVYTADPAAASWVPAIEAARKAAAQELPAGVYVEDKRLSVSLHYRKHPECRNDVELWARANASRFGLTEQRGRMVVELKPPVSIDKGTILNSEIEDLGCAWYFGDDISDAQAFQAIRDRRQQDPAFMGVCVAVRNAETGQSLEEQADFTLASPADVPAVLVRAVELLASV
jgi:trehalose 6-phosphate phosphatase